MNTKHRSIAKRSLVTVVTILAGLCAGQEAAVAQSNSETIKGPFTTLMKKSIEAGKQKGGGTSSSISAVLGTTVELPGGAPLNKQTSSESPGTAEEEIDAGANEFTYDQVTLAPLRGFRQLAGAEPIQQMYKDLINKPVPVLFQTMMMVENGAATGFIGSMNAVSGLMSNTVETSALSIKLMEMTDGDVADQLKYAYVGRLRTALKSNEVESWPAALYVASGDAAKGEIGKFDKLPDQPVQFDFAGHPQVQAKSTASTGTEQQKQMEFIKDILMPDLPNQNGNEETTHKNNKLAEARQEVVESLGDLTIMMEEPEGKDKLGRIIKIDYKKPKEKDKRWGVQRRAYEESEEAWKNLFDLLNKMCEFKRTNDNNSKEPTEKVLQAQAVQWEPEMWEGASAPDIQMTENLLQQFFMLSKPSNDLQKIDCAKDYPPGGQLKYPNGIFAAATADKPDSCEAGTGTEGVPPCIRYLVLNKVATTIGNSRALHTYDAMEQSTVRFAKNKATREMLDRLFAEMFGNIQIGQFIDINRDSWFSFGLNLAKYMQGQQGGGANFRPATNNALPSYRQGTGDSSGGGN